jgi:hypothetical protein
MSAGADSLASDLWRRLLWVCPELGLSLFGWSVMPHPPSLAEYDGVRYVHFLDQLNDHDRVMAVLHELGHAYLHPPGSGELAGEHLDEAEERLVHNAAAQASEALGLHGYVEIMAGHGAPRQLLAAVDPEERFRVDEIAAFLETAVRNPEHPPAWLIDPKEH